MHAPAKHRAANLAALTPPFPRDRPEFSQWFREESDCLGYLAAIRWQDGFACPKCSGNEAWEAAPGCAAARPAESGFLLHAGPSFTEHASRSGTGLRPCGIFAARRTAAAPLASNGRWASAATTPVGSGCTACGARQSCHPARSSPAKWKLTRPSLAASKLASAVEGQQASP